MSVRRSNSTAMGMRELKCFDDVPSAISITAVDRGKNFHSSLLNYSTPQIAKQLTLMQQAWTFFYLIYQILCPAALLF